MTIRIPTSALLAGALVFLAQAVNAQSPEVSDTDLKQHGMSVAEVGRLLDGRDRELLHPGQPLIVVGNEEGDNEFRHGTPLLEGALASRGTLDLDEARSRRREMYEAGARFSAPLRRSGAGGMGFDSSCPPSNSNPGPEQPAPATQEPAPGATKTSFLLWLFGCLSLAVVAYRKRHVFTHLS